MRGNKKKMFWKKLKQVRESEQATNEIIKDANGQILRDVDGVRKR